MNFLFFEKGFRKLALREVRLRLGDHETKNKNCIYCAGTSDYTAWLRSYGDYFLPKAKIRHDDQYELSEEFIRRKKINQYWCKPVKKYEIIKVENIPYLIKLLPWDFIVVPLWGKIVSSTYNISSKG